MISVNGNDSSVNSAPMDPQGPAGTANADGPLKTGDQLSSPIAQKLVEGSNGQLKVENGYLVGPDGLKIKIGAPLTDQDIRALAKYAPEVVNGKTKEEPAESAGKGDGDGDGGHESAPAGGPPAAPPAAPTDTSAAPASADSPADAIKSGSELSPKLAQKIAADSKGQLKVEDGFLMGPNGLKIPVGKKLDDADIQALAKYAPNAVNGTAAGSDAGMPPASGDPSAIPSTQSDAPQPMPA